MPGYHPHLKGKIERVFESVDQMLLSQLPGYTGGPRRLNGSLDGPVDDRLAAREAYGEAPIIASHPAGWGLHAPRNHDLLPIRAGR